jgi:hypothetical protein
MLRRAITQLLVPLVLLPCVVAHSHAWTSIHDPSGQYRPPHVHLRFFYPSWWQSRNDQDYYRYLSNAKNKSFTRNRSAPDHDDDAIYLPVSVLLGWHSDPPVAPLLKTSALVTPAGTIYLLEAAVSIPLPLFFPPVVQGRLCPIYLRSLTLLI